jgi:hypothetical protein
VKQHPRKGRIIGCWVVAGSLLAAGAAGCQRDSAPTNSDAQKRELEQLNQHRQKEWQNKGK